MFSFVSLVTAAAAAAASDNVDLATSSGEENDVDFLFGEVGLS